MAKVIAVIICILLLGYVLNQSIFSAPTMRSVGSHVLESRGRSKGIDKQALRTKEARVRQAFREADREIASAGR